VAGFHVLSDRGDWIETAVDDDYSALLYFNKAGGLFEAVISPDTKSGFLGMGTPQPERIWADLGYTLVEDLREKTTWTNGDARIIAYYGRPHWLNEIHYVVPEASDVTNDAALAWRELGFFGGGRGCIESAVTVTGRCYATKDAADGHVQYAKQQWSGSIPEGFWLVTAEVDDLRQDCRYCVAWDSRHDRIATDLSAALRGSGQLPDCKSKSFRLTPRDLFDQTQIDVVHIKGLLKTSP
jgi:hypothetical protein